MDKEELQAKEMLRKLYDVLKKYDIPAEKRPDLVTDLHRAGVLNWEQQ